MSTAASPEGRKLNAAIARNLNCAEGQRGEGERGARQARTGDSHNDDEDERSGDKRRSGRIEHPCKRTSHGFRRADPCEYARRQQRERQRRRART
jgi:hypothetical protein